MIRTAAKHAGRNGKAPVNVSSAAAMALTMGRRIAAPAPLPAHLPAHN